MLSVLHWHPMVVHLPLGLWLTAAPLCTAARLARGEGARGALATVATVNLVLGSAAACAALATGLLAASSLDTVGIAQDTLTRHVAWAFLTTTVFLALTLLRAVGRPVAASPGNALIVCLWLASAGLLVTGYYGGRNVYAYGLGVDLALSRERAEHRPQARAVAPPVLP